VKLSSFGAGTRGEIPFVEVKKGAKREGGSTSTNTASASTAKVHFVATTVVTSTTTVP
jgi:hypothetical protein